MNMAKLSRKVKEDIEQYPKAEREDNLRTLKSELAALERNIKVGGSIVSRDEEVKNKAMNVAILAIRIHDNV